MLLKVIRFGLDCSGLRQGKRGDVMTVRMVVTLITREELSDMDQGSRITQPNKCSLSE
jgi:hypothetical protein